MNKITKYVFLSVSIIIISVIYIGFGAEGEIKPYYSGDAVAVGERVIFGSINNGGVLELFEYSDDTIQRGGVIKASQALLPLNAKKRIYDFAITNENGKAFVYTAEGRKLSKYDISNIKKPAFVSQVLESNGDWYTGLKKYDGRLMTVGTKEVKLWNYSLQNIDNFKILAKDSYNIGVSEGGEYIFNIGTTSVDIYDTITRSYRYNVDLDINGKHYRKPYYDANLNKVFVADDEKINQFTASGEVTKTRKHISSSGYDVAAVQDSKYVYATDGLGVIKLEKSTLNQVKWVYTTNINNKKGGWAMGLNVVGTGSNEKLVIFNNNNIVVMDSDLKVLGSVAAIDETVVAFIEEPLSLKADRTDAVANTPVLLTGTGFAYNENIEIIFANKSFTAKTDENGRFKVSITVPSVLPGRTDIKVNGLASKLTYSTTFTIQ